MRLVLLAVCLLLAGGAAGADRDAAGLYERYCGKCHDPERAGPTPTLDELRLLAPEEIFGAMLTGTMKQPAQHLSDEEKRLLAEWIAGRALGSAPPALRVDYVHRGDARREEFVLDGVWREGEWPGPEGRPRSLPESGKYRFVVRDVRDGRLHYAGGFSSIYGEWETTAEAKKRTREFHESIRFPMPPGPVRIVIEKRDRRNRFQPVWSTVVRPERARPAPIPEGMKPKALLSNDDPNTKVDLLILGDGYAAAEMERWRADAARAVEALFSVSPFRERRSDFNVWILDTPARESGVSRPSDGVERDSPLRASYDAFGSERYVLIFDNKRLRDLAAAAPYDFLLILVNERKYGGGGIYNLYATAAARNAFTPYLVVHEFAHHFAGLADEYYTSEVAYEFAPDAPEPWEPNVTRDPQAGKWADLVTPGVPLPTPWPKAEFERRQRDYQARRKQLRAAGASEEELERLFREEREWTTKLLSQAKYAGKVGAFEGANYSPRGYYRPQVDCLMFTRDEVGFCAVCRRAIERVIDAYAGR